MWSYYLLLGLKSLKRNPFLTALMVLILGFGVAASMIAYTVVHVMGGDPIPHKSSTLFVPLVDNGQISDYHEGDEPDDQMSYLDAAELLRAGKGRNRTAIYGIGTIVDVGKADLVPTAETGIATTRAFFELFEPKFKYGEAWGEPEDASGSDVVVLGEKLAEKLFGPDDPVGRSIKLDDRPYRVVGVLAHWVPVPRYYRLLGGNSDSQPEALIVPFRNAISREWSNNGTTNCGGGDPGIPGFAGFLKRECNWIQYWVELHGEREVAEYGDYLKAHIAEQRKLGRFPRPDNFRLRNVMDWMDHMGVVDADTRLQNYVSLGFLIVCIANVVGLLLAKFTGRAGEIGVRRALGATRGDIARQSLVEVGVIGLAGAATGLLLSHLGLGVLDRFAYEGIGVFRLDPFMVAMTLLFALGSAVLAGLLPTWIASRQVPALQLKSQ